MNVEERKVRLIGLISALENEEVLGKLEALLLQKADWAHELTEEEKQKIWEGIEQAEKGQVIPAEQVWAFFDARFQTGLSEEERHPNERHPQKDWWTELPEEVKQSIDQGRKDCAEGRVLSRAEAKRKLKTNSEPRTQD